MTQAEYTSSQTRNAAGNNIAGPLSGGHQTPTDGAYGTVPTQSMPLS